MSEMIKAYQEINKRRQSNDMDINSLTMFAEAWNHQQAKIDCMKVKLDGANERAMMMFNHKNVMVDKMQAKIDELQARVDEITNHVGVNFDEERDDDQHSYWSGYNQAMRELNDILKGNKDEK